MHHTLGGGDFDVFVDMYSKVTVAQTMLTPFNAAKEIDRVLIACWLKKRPVYIGIPSGVSYHEIEAPETKLNLAYPASPIDAVREAVERMAKLLEKAKKPIILADICAIRHPMSNLLVDFLDKTGIPFATMNMGKAIINESHPQFIGIYSGDLSAPGVQERVEKSDCIIAFGSIMSDLNTGGFTSHLDANATIEIHSSYIKLKHSIYPNLYFNEVIPALLKRLAGYHYNETITKQPLSDYKAQNKPLTQERFWQRMSRFLMKNAIVIADAGTSLFGILPMPMPDGATFVGQPLWSSIGYTVGATLGTCLAAPKRQSLLFVGDGSFQLTAQEVSTMIRHHLMPIIFLINNDGYTVERVIHGPKEPYNDIQMWKYAELPKIFGGAVWTTKVSTETQLEEVLQNITQHRDKLVFIEVIMNKDDSPEVLKKIGMALSEQNKS